MFVYRRGGDRDRITDFENNVDTIRLDDSLGLADADAALAKARQVGADVVFDFGGGDILTVENTTKSVLGNDLLIVDAADDTGDGDGTGDTSGSGSSDGGTGSGGGGSDVERTTVQASGNLTGSEGNQRFVIGADEVILTGGGGSDLYEVTDVASVRRHKLLDFDAADDVIDISAMVGAGAAGDPQGHVRLAPQGWSGGSVVDLQVDRDGGGDGWQTALRLEDVPDLYDGEITLDDLIDAEAVLL